MPASVVTEIKRVELGGGLKDPWLMESFRDCRNGRVCYSQISIDQLTTILSAMDTLGFSSV